MSKPVSSYSTIHSVLTPGLPRGGMYVYISITRTESCHSHFLGKFAAKELPFDQDLRNKKIKNMHPREGPACAVLGAPISVCVRTARTLISFSKRLVKVVSGTFSERPCTHPLSLVLKNKEPGTAQIRKSRKWLNHDPQSNQVV